MTKLSTGLRAVILGGALLATTGIVVASAQDQAGPRFGRNGLMASTRGGPTCPWMEWHLAPIPEKGDVMLNGVAYYRDMSGISVIKGGIGADGKIYATLTSVNGNGPVGTVSGLRTAKEYKGALVGAGCANATFDMARWEPGPIAGDARD